MENQENRSVRADRGLIPQVSPPAERNGTQNAARFCPLAGSPRKLVGALFILMLAAMMAVASGASFTSTSANVGNVVTAGTLSHGNTTCQPGNVILNVTDLMPGDRHAARSR